MHRFGRDLLALTRSRPIPPPHDGRASALAPASEAAMDRERRAAIDHGRARRRDFRTVRVLGIGSKAAVKLAVRLSDGRELALKSIRKPGRHADGDSAASGSPQRPAHAGPHGGASDSAGDYAALEREWRTEVRALEIVGQHENMPELIEAFETSSKWYIALEFQRGGDLFSRLAVMGQFTELHASAVIATIVNAVHFLHAHGIAHRDLKPANLLMKDESENSNLCLVDFGAGFVMDRGITEQAATNRPLSSAVTRPSASRSTSDLHRQSMKTITGTPFYLAPEIVVGMSYTTKVDMWSLGCIAYQLLVGVTPFQSSVSFEQLYHRIVTADYAFPDDIPLSDLAKDFVSSLLVADPNRRFSAGQAMRHPWIRQGVPPSYLLLLLEFNHEANPDLFSAPSLEILNDTSPNSDSWGLRSLPRQSAGGAPSLSVPGSLPDALPGALPLSKQPSDETLGRSIRSRWEQQGRPGVLQIPSTSYPGPADAASPLSDGDVAMQDGFQSGNLNLPDLLQPIRRAISGMPVWASPSGHLQVGEDDDGDGGGPEVEITAASGPPEPTPWFSGPATAGDADGHQAGPQADGMAGQYAYGTVFSGGFPATGAFLWDSVAPDGEADNDEAPTELEPAPPAGSFGQPAGYPAGYQAGQHQQGGHAPYGQFGQYAGYWAPQGPQVPFAGRRGSAGLAEPYQGAAEGEGNRSGEIARVRGLVSDLAGFGFGRSG